MSSSKLLFAFIAGAAAGASVAILLSTDKGREIGKKVVGKAKSIADIILNKAEEILDEAEAVASKSAGEKI